MIIPPALPYASQQREFYDLPMPEETKDNRYDGRFRYDRHLSSIPILTIPRPVVYQLTPEIIRTCTPDCSASHCTTECKCANTHPAVHAKCNPPPSADFVGICQAWIRLNVRNMIITQILYEQLCLLKTMFKLIS
uniref:Uncharacterized protein n=1 Tax=Acrobeloides nanus TaxID=290746 RepID=A0A914EAM9_9BILA